MMRALLNRFFVAAALLAAPAAMASEEPADDRGWRVSAKPVEAKAGEPTTLKVDLVVLDGHYVYGGERTAVTLGDGAPGTLSKIEAPPAKTKFDKFDQKEVPIYETGTHTFSVVMTFTKPGKVSVPLKVKSQACTAEYCLFPATVPVSVPVTVAAASAALITTPAPVPTVTPGATAATTPAVAAATATPEPTPAMAIAATAPAEASRGSIFSDDKRMAELIAGHFLMALGIAFLGGLLISGTPCVYPMIPITIAVIGAQSASSRWRGFSLSLVYVAGITLVYSILGVVAAMSSREFGFLLQSPAVRIAIALVFAALAASMFGAFTIQMPGSIQTKLLGYQGSGVAGVFVTGLFAGIVAGPCTAPVLLGILIAISSGVVGPLGGFALMAAFSLGMGVLFVVLGTFSGLLSSLPKSGSWMENVKHGFGVLLVIGALYYWKLAVPEWAYALALGACLVVGGFVLFSIAKPVVRGAAALAIAAGLWFFMGGLATSGWGPEWLPRGGVASAPVSRGPEMPWITDEAEGRRLSAETGKPMLVDFYADWCEACKELDHYTYVDPRVVAASKDFIPVKIDTTIRVGMSEEAKAEIDRLKARYAIRGLPWVVFVTPQGDTLDDLRLIGFESADDFLKRMQSAKERSLRLACGAGTDRPC